MEKTIVGKAGLYLVNATAGNIDMDGAPILHLSLLVNPATGSVSGQARQTQAIPGPGSDIQISNVVGQVRHTGLGQCTKIVSLVGEALITAQPPAIGAYIAPFSAHFGINDAWEGKGGWSLGSTNVEDVPIRSDK